MVEPRSGSGQPKRPLAGFPPLWVWGLATVLVAAIAIGTLVLPGQYAAVYAAYNRQIRAFSATHDARPKVVLLGTSLARLATPTEPEVEDAFRLGGKSVRFLKFARRDATVDFYEPFVPDIIALHPDLLIIQIEVLDGDGTSPAAEARESVRLLLQGTPGGYGATIEPPVSELCSEGHSPAHFRRARRFTESRFAEFHGFGAAVSRLLDACQKHGIQVLVLQFARSRELRAVSAGPERWREQAHREIGRWPEVRFASFGEDLPLSDYCDYSHYNAVGQRRFMEWFVPHVSALLEGQRR